MGLFLSRTILNLTLLEKVVTYNTLKLKKDLCEANI